MRTLVWLASVTESLVWFCAHNEAVAGWIGDPGKKMLVTHGA